MGTIGGEEKYNNMYLCDFTLFILATKHRTRETALHWNLIRILKNWPCFLIVEWLNESRNRTKLSPFALSKPIHSIAGGAKGIKKLLSAQLLVEVDKPMQSSKLLKDNISIDSDINVDAHRSLNICKGVIDQIT